MALQKQTSKEYFKIITVVYFGLLTGQVIFALITIFLHLRNLFTVQDVSELKQVFFFIVPIVVLNGFFTGNLIYKFQLKKIKKLDNLISKMVQYKSAMIIRLAFIEGSSFFCIVVYLLTGDFIFIGSAALLILYFITLNPTADKISVELELNPTEKFKIDNPDEIIAEFETNKFQ